MVKVITTYACQVCGQVYQAGDQALFCELQPVTQDDGLPQVGDYVRITEGQGCGAWAKVTSRHILPCLAHIQRRYWHTPTIHVELAHQGGELHRVLYFDQYEHGVRMNLAEVLHGNAG